MCNLSEKALIKTLDQYGFKETANCSRYNALGQTWQLDEKIGEGYFWSYFSADLFSIKIHDFTFNSDTIVESDMPEGLNIAYYTSISGEELNPYRRLNANCVRSHLNGYKTFKALMHKNIPIHSIGIEIMPAYYEDYLRQMYPGEYASPYDAFLEVDETSEFPEMIALLQEIKSYKETGMAGLLFYQGKVSEIVSLVIERKKRVKELKDVAVSPIDMIQIMTITSYISGHYASELTIGQLAQIACMGETKLKKLFKQVHQCTIIEFIQNLRVSQAEYLLSHTDYPIKQVGQSVGYRHTSHFADLFRRTTGLLPGEYRKMAQRK